MCLLLSWDFAFKTESAEVRKGGEQIMEHFKINGRMRDKGRGRETQPKTRKQQKNKNKKKNICL